MLVVLVVLVLVVLVLVVLVLMVLVVLVVLLLVVVLVLVVLVLLVLVLLLVVVTRTAAPIRMPLNVLCCFTIAFRFAVRRPCQGHHSLLTPTVECVLSLRTCTRMKLRILVAIGT
jgi:hypothetical protein